MPPWKVRDGETSAQREASAQAPLALLAGQKHWPCAALCLLQNLFCHSRTDNNHSSVHCFLPLPAIYIFFSFLSLLFSGYRQERVHPPGISGAKRWTLRTAVEKD